MSYRVGERLLDGEIGVVIPAAVVATALVVAPFVLGPVQTSLLITVLLFAVLGTAFNLLYGYTGLLSFGHAMFVAAAAYTSAKTFGIIGPMLGFPELFGGVSILVTFATAVVLGVVVATILAVFVGYLSVQLEEIYFAMITLSFSMAFYVILLQDITGQLTQGFGETVHSLFQTNGEDGLTIAYAAIGQVDLFGVTFTFMDITSYLVYYFVVLLFSVASLYALWRIVQSPFGTVCKAIRENPQRARALGINVTRHSWATFVVSGLFSGLVGTLWAPFQTSIIPGLGHWTFSAIPVIVTVIGGPYSFLGPAIGAFVYRPLRWQIEQNPVLAARWQLVFGIILVFVVIFFTNGVAGGLERLRDWLAVAAERYREDGIAGVASFTWETVAGWIRRVRKMVVGWIRRIRRVAGS